MLVLSGVALAGRRAAGVGVGAALLGWRRLLGLRGARCWAWATGGAGVAHSRLRRVAGGGGAWPGEAVFSNLVLAKKLYKKRCALARGEKNRGH